MRSNKDVLFLFSSHDISTVQGTTEPYYACKGLSEDFEMHVFAPLSSDIENVQTHSFRVGGLLGTFLLNSLLLPYFMWMGIKHKPTLIYSYRNVITPPYILMFVAKARLIYDVRVDPYEQPKEFNRETLLNKLFLTLNKYAHSIMFSRADTVITLSEPLKEQLRRNFGIPEDKIHIVPLGVDADKFKVIDSPGDKFRIVYIGSAPGYRGLITVIRALLKLNSDLRKRVEFEMFGSADEKLIREIEKLAKEGEFEFTYHGYVPHEEIPERAASADVAVSPLPELDSFEVSSPAKIYEYLAMGLPVVATKITPHERILVDGVDSILVEPEDSEDMRDAFQRLMEDPDYLSELSRSAREKGEQNSWDSRIQSIVEIINGALSQ